MVLLATRSLPTLPRQAGPAARRAVHGVAGSGSRHVMTSRLQQLSRRSGASPASCMGPAALTTSLMRGSTTIRLMSSAKREKVKVLAVLYDGGKHADEVSFSCLFSRRLSLKHKMALPSNARYPSTAAGAPLAQMPPELRELQALKKSTSQAFGMRGSNRHPIKAGKKEARPQSMPSQLCTLCSNGSWLCRGTFGIERGSSEICPPQSHNPSTPGPTSR